MIYFSGHHPKFQKLKMIDPRNWMYPVNCNRQYPLMWPRVFPIHWTDRKILGPKLELIRVSLRNNRLHFSSGFIPDQPFTFLWLTPLLVSSFLNVYFNPQTRSMSHPSSSRFVRFKTSLCLPSFSLLHTHFLFTSVLQSTYKECMMYLVVLE